MKTVHKFEVESMGQRFPAGKVVLFGPDAAGYVCVWIERDTESEGAQLLQVFGTGHEVPEGNLHLASCKEGSMIWHLYEVGAPS
jgi:hypothetical protein